MMATKRQQERKKKAREERGRARVAARRHKLQEIKREERRSAAADKKFRDRQKPFVKDPEKRRAMEEAEKARAEEKIRRNMEILKALEEEYNRDVAAKKSVNDALEADGHVTLREKFDALESRAREANGLPQRDEMEAPQENSKVS